MAADSYGQVVTSSRAGRPAKLGPRQQGQVIDLFNSGMYTVTEISRMFAVSPATIYRAVVRSDREMLGQS